MQMNVPGLRVQMHSMCCLRCVYCVPLPWNDCATAEQRMGLMDYDEMHTPAGCRGREKPLQIGLCLRFQMWMCSKCGCATDPIYTKSSWLLPGPYPTL